MPVVKLARTRELMLHYLPPPAPTVLLDIGGATGIYAFWFAGCGHSVHLLDIVSRHIEQARNGPAGDAADPGSETFVTVLIRRMAEL